MERTRTLMLYGASLSIAAIGAGLADRPGWQVIPVDALFPAATESPRQSHSDVVLSDLAAAHPEAAIALLTEFPNLLLIGIDLANHQASVLSSEQPKLFTTDDFIRLVELCAAQAYFRDKAVASSGGSR